MNRIKLLAYSALFAASFFVPAHADVIVGLPAAPATGNCFPFGCSYSGEYQQVYNANQFSGPLTISELQFYNTQYNSGASAMNSGTWTIALSTTSADWNTLSSTFATNIGADNTTVFSGNLSQPWAFGDTLTIDLTTPFSYTPGSGANLLLDVMVSGASSPGGNIYFDVNDNNTFLARNYQGIVDNGYGLVTGFVAGNTPVPEPLTMSIFGAGLVGVAALRRRRTKKA